MAVARENTIVSAKISNELLEAIDQIADGMAATRSQCIAQILGTYALDRLDAVTRESFDATASGLASALRRASK